MSPPTVSVLMPVRNGRAHVREAVESILAQDLADFEFIIINDGSTDDSAQIIRSFSDPRIRLVENERNLGLASSLNRGMDLARGKYLARMDCDDLCRPERLRLQAEFLDNNPEIDILGSRVYFLDRPGEILRHPLSDRGVRWRMALYCALAHPSVMLRLESFNKHGLRYDESFSTAQDYDLWVRSAPFLRMANLEAPLVGYRTHAAQASQAKRTEQREYALRVQARHLDNLPLSVTAREKELHRLAVGNLPLNGPEEIKEIEEWLLKLDRESKKDLGEDEEELGPFLGWTFFVVCNTSARFGLKAFRLFNRSPLARKGGATFLQRMKFLLKCLARYDRTKNAESP